MKKLLTLSIALFLISACSNKHIMVKKTEKYPVKQYITKIAYDTQKDTAKENALKEIKGIFNSLKPGDTYTQARREAVLDSAKVVETWKDKTNNKYYALAVISREQAQKLIEPAYAMIDSKMQNMADNINKE